MVVALIAIALCAVLAVQRMPVDIFPQVGDPAIYVAQPYGGMDPAQMEGYLTYYYEYHFLYITGIDHVESKSIQGAALMKLVFHEGTDMSQAMAETVGYVNRARAFMPPGTVPPFITRFDAGSVAVGQLVFSSPIQHPGRNAGLRAQPRAPAVRHAARRLRAAALRRQPAHHRRHARSRQAPAVPHLARRGHRRRQQRQPRHALRQHVRPATSTASPAPTPRSAATSPNCSSTPIRPAPAPPSICATSAPSKTAPTSITAYAHVNGKRTVYIPVTKRADASTLASSTP